MGLLSRWLSFERPLGGILVQLIYYLGVFVIGLRCLERIYMGLLMIMDQFGDGQGLGDGVWMILSAPVKAIIAACLLRIVAEFLRSVFRIDQSLREIVTGRAAAGAGLTRQPLPDQSPD